MRAAYDVTGIGSSGTRFSGIPSERVIGRRSCDTGISRYILPSCGVLDCPCVFMVDGDIIGLGDELGVAFN